MIITNECNGFKIQNIIYLHCFSMNNNQLFKLILFLLIIRAEVTLISKAVIVRNFINQAAPMIIRNIKTM